jgi:hypothetical protein
LFLLLEVLIRKQGPALLVPNVGFWRKIISFHSECRLSRRLFFS